MNRLIGNENIDIVYSESSIVLSAIFIGEDDLKKCKLIANPATISSDKP